MRNPNVDGFNYRVYSTTNILGRPPRFCHSSVLSSMGARFCSVYAVRQEDGFSIEKDAGTAAGFKGIVWSQRLWIDIDTEEAAKGARRIIKEMELDHVVYSTGNRGCHIGVARDCRPSHTLPGQDKAWVQANIPGADLSLYWHLHLIRLPGAIHEATGKPKTLLERSEGKALLLPKPQEEQERSIQLGSNNEHSIFSHWEILSRLTENKEMSRHKQLVTLAMALRDTANAGYEEAAWIVKEVNKGFTEPKPESEIDRIVKWAYDRS